MAQLKVRNSSIAVQSLWFAQWLEHIASPITISAMTLRWIFFDCFNTLIDDFDEQGSISGLNCIMHIPVDAGYFSDAEAFCLAYEAARAVNWGQDQNYEVNLDTRLRFVLEQHGAGNDAIELSQAMLQLWEKRYYFELRLGQGVPEMLEAWSHDYRFALVSNFYLPQWPEKFLAYYGLDRYFTHIFDSAAIGFKKPHPNFYKHAIRESAADPKTVLFVGDCHLRDVVTPREHGMAAIHRCRHGERPGIEPSPETHVIRSWDQFRPEQITPLLADLY